MPPMNVTWGIFSLSFGHFIRRSSRVDHAMVVTVTTSMQRPAPIGISSSRTCRRAAIPWVPGTRPRARSRSLWWWQRGGPWRLKSLLRPHR
jgi:hypothetical protein